MHPKRPKFKRSKFTVAYMAAAVKFPSLLTGKQYQYYCEEAFKLEHELGAT